MFVLSKNNNIEAETQNKHQINKQVNQKARTQTSLCYIITAMLRRAICFFSPVSFSYLN